MSLAELITAAGLAPDALAGRSFRCSDVTARLMLTHEISRRPVPLEVWRLARILAAIASDTPLPPVHLRHPRRLLDGHHRLMISELLGAATVPVIHRP